ncbi:MAG TPA: agmatine deiminase, partial [Candidatus Marinimicrobia bacterium]|nr:agmatine deiminase [Candidatus Neomarinimicrobiota bacterium]
WVRDMGPTFVVNDKSSVRGVDWEFNARGGLIDGLYFSWDLDDKAARKICEIENLDSYRADGFVLEGGSIHTDGEGTLIVTEACLLSPGRNPQFSKKEIEKKLKSYLNVQKIIWLERGIYNDETNEHVDNIIHYCAPVVVALAWTDDPEDPQYELSQKAYTVLSTETDAKGRHFEIHKLHIPSPVLITKEESEGVDAIDGTLPRLEGDRQAASYTNFYICNGGVIFPLFDDPIYDKKAKRVLEKIFPDREVLGISAREIILGGGNIHCITQQQPLG